MRIEILCHLCAPVPGIIYSLIFCVQVNLENEGLDVTLVFDYQKSGLEFLHQGQFLGECATRLSDSPS